MKLKINDRAALAIKNNTKRVEIRVNKNDDKDYSNLARLMAKILSEKINIYW